MTIPSSPIPPSTPSTNGSTRRGPSTTPDLHDAEEVKRRVLPGIVSGRERWCQGFSEPDAGSDLASVRTRADRDGDDYVITGHKVWTSYSDGTDWCLVLARTDHRTAKHRGVSAFTVPMHQSGVEQRPLPKINGVAKELGEVLFDGARVPAGNVICEPGEVWPLAVTVVGHERERSSRLRGPPQQGVAA